MALEKIGVEAVIEGLSSFRRGMNQIDGDIKDVGKTSKTTGSNVTDMFKSFLSTGAVVGAIATVGRAVNQFAQESIAEFQQFDKQASEVFTLLPGLTTQATDSMKADILEFSAAVGRQTDETIPALYQAISAGVPAENVFDFLQVASDAALGGVTDLETAVDGITSVVNAYGDEVIDAATASDVMFTAVRLGKTNFEQLSSSLFNVIPTAASLGVTFTDVAANLAALTAQGTPTSVATTQLRQAFVEASKSGSKLDLALRELTGKGFADLIASGKTSSEIFLDLRGSMPEQEFRDLFGSVEAANAVLGITSDTAQGIIEDFGTVEDTLGATAAAAETMADSMEHLEARTAATTEALKIQAGEALSPLKREWLELRVATNDYLSEDLALRQQLLDSSATLEEYGYNGVTLQKTLGGLGEGTIFWRDSLEDADVIARRTAIAVEILDRGLDLSKGTLAEQAVALDIARQSSLELGQATETTDQILNNYVRTQEVATEQAAELARVEREEAMQAALELGKQTESVDQILNNYVRTAEVAEEQSILLAESEKEQAEAARIAAEAEREHNAVLANYFNASLTAEGQTKSLERSLYDKAVAEGVSAEKLVILATATGEFTQEEIDAAFQAALMSANIDTLVAAMQNGTITAGQATDALGLLKAGEAETAAGAISLIQQFDGAAGSLVNVSNRANEATNNLNNIPNDIPVTIRIHTEGSVPALPTGPGGQQQPQAFQSGGFTGRGPRDEFSGLVHYNEIVLPQDVLMGGASDILGFVNANMPNGIANFGGSVAAQPSVVNQSSMQNDMSRSVQVNFENVSVSNDMDLQMLGDFIVQKVSEAI